MLEVDAGDPDALRLAAEASRLDGRIADAQNYEVKALENWQRTPLLQDAARALAEKRFPEAEALIRRRLKVAPDDLSAISMLASIAALSGAHDDARSMHEAVLARAPGFLPAQVELLQILDEQTAFAEALVQVRSLRKRDPDNPRWPHQEMTLLVRTGQFESALKLVDEMLGERPDDQVLIIARGNILKTFGRSDEAVATFRRSAELDPAMGEAWWSLANMKTHAFSDDDIARMQSQLAANIDDKHRANMFFALGSAHEKAGNTDASFEHYSKGNALWRTMHGYKAELVTGIVDATVGDLAKHDLRRPAGDGSAAPTPIFVVGMPRAGSTLVEQILSSHSAIEGTAELPYIPALSRQAGYQVGPRSPVSALRGMSDKDRDELARLYLDRAGLHRSENLPYFIDKTPNNWMFVPLILAIMPNAKIIDVRRDAMACCFANFKQHFASGQMFTYSLEDMGRYYRDYVRMMDHLDDIAPGAVHRILYEDLIADTEGEVRQALDYLDLEFQPACLEFHRNKRAVRTASAEQVRQPIRAGTNDAWKPYAQWLEPLRDALGPLAKD